MREPWTLKLENLREKFLETQLMKYALGKNRF